MDRVIVYPGAIPLDTDILAASQNAMIGLGYLARAVVGTATIVDGLAISATGTPSMTVNVAPGSIMQLSTIDATNYGSIAADSVNPLVKIGINTTSTPFTLTAPGTSGKSINYLIEATLAEADDTAIVLPYYNAAAPNTPFNGPAGAGTSQNTRRTQRVSLQLKAGAAANTGTQATPAVDSGWVGLYVITVNFGQTTITNSNLATVTMATAPFIPAKLGPGFNPGFSRFAIFTSSGSWTVPAGVTTIKVTAQGAGGGGGGAGATGASTVSAAAGGNAGCLAVGIYTVTPGTVYTVTIGASGTAGAAGFHSGGNGGTTSLGSLISAPGGAGGPGAAAGSPVFQISPAIPTNVASGANIVIGREGVGCPGIATAGTNTVGGCGAPSMWGGQGYGDWSSGPGHDASGYGSGGSGAAVSNSGSALAGGGGGAGILIVEY